MSEIIRKRGVAEDALKSDSSDVSSAKKKRRSKKQDSDYAAGVPPTAKLSVKVQHEPKDAVLSPPSRNDSDADVSISGTATPAKGKDRRFKSAHKPISGSYLPHIGALLVSPIAQRCSKQGKDLRTADLSTLREVTGGLYTEQELERLAFFLKQEYPEPTTSMTDILSYLQPLVKVSMKLVHKEVIKTKYKDEMPKLPKSSFQYYITKKVAKIKEKNPDVNGWTIRTQLTEKWAKMDPEDKKVYDEKYQKAKKRHEERWKQFSLEHPDAVFMVSAHKPSKSPRMTKEQQKLAAMTEEERRQFELHKQAPKHPPTAYVLFCNAKRDKVRQKHPDLSMKQIMQKLGEKWKALSQESQSMYRQQNQEHMAKYHQDVVEFYDDHPEAVPPPRTAKLLERLRKPEVVPSSSEDDEEEEEEEDRPLHVDERGPKEQENGSGLGSSSGSDSDSSSSGSSSGSDSDSNED